MNHETCVMYKERLFDRNGHTFRLMAVKDHGETWVSQLQIKSPFEAHLHATSLMKNNALEYQIWIVDETTNEGILPLQDICLRYNRLLARRQLKAEGKI